MTDDFINSFRSEDDFDNDPEGDLPEWIGGVGPDDADDFDDEEDDFDQLRRKSARSGSTYDDMALDGDGSEGLSLNHLTPSQRVILAGLLFLDVLIIIVGLLLITGRI
ncbi:MAG: hypothetical protein R6X32_22970 [Chloroflexota bacterium]|jgi:hypothetical protein